MAGGTWTRYFPKKKERAPISYLDSGRRATGYHETVKESGSGMMATGQPAEIINSSSKYAKLRDKARSSKKSKWIRERGLSG